MNRIYGIIQSYGNNPVFISLREGILDWVESGSFPLLITRGIARLDLLKSHWDPGSSRAGESRGN